MRKVATLALTTTAFVTLEAAGYSIHVRLERAIADADTVALIRVNSSRELTAADGTSCGRSYSATIIEPVKGLSKGERFEFGHYSGRKVGNKYIVILANAGLKLDSTYSVYRLSGFPTNKVSSEIERCERYRPDFRETFEGLGTFMVDIRPKTDWYVSVGFFNFFESFGISRFCDVAEVSCIKDFAIGNANVSLRRFLDYLHELAGMSGK